MSRDPPRLRGRGSEEERGRPTSMQRVAGDIGERLQALVKWPIVKFSCVERGRDRALRTSAPIGNAVPDDSGGVVWYAHVFPPARLAHVAPNDA